MAFTSKVSAEEKQKAVDSFHVKEATVRQIAKRLRVSTPAVYQWIEADRKARAEEAQTSHINPVQIEQHKRLTCKAQLEIANRKIAQLERIIARMSVQLYENKN